MLRTGGTSFKPAPNMPIPMSAPTGSIRAVDLDGDGLLDIVTGSQRGGEVSVRLGKGDGSFRAPFALDCKGDSPYVAIGDMNGDGLPDIVTGNYDGGSVSVLLNQGRK